MAKWIKWIKWEGGDCPVEKGTLVDVKYRDGVIQKGIPALMRVYGVLRLALWWSNESCDGDIVAYRLHKEPRLKNTLAREWGEWPKGISRVGVHSCGSVKAVSVGGGVDQSLDLTHINTQDPEFVYKAQWQRARAKYLAKHNGIYSTMKEENKLDNQIDLYAAKDRIQAIKGEISALEAERDTLLVGIANAGFSLLGEVKEAHLGHHLEGVSLDISDYRSWKKWHCIECVDDSDWDDVSQGSVYELLRDAKYGLCFLDDVGDKRELSPEETEKLSHEFKLHSTGSE